MTPEIQLIEQNQEIITTTKTEPKYKTCRDCKKQDFIETFPLVRNSQSEPYVYAPRCAECLPKWRHEKKKKLKANKPVEIPSLYKTCVDCKKQDLIETFPKTKNRGKYVPMSRCSLCLAEFRKSYRVKAEKKEQNKLKNCRTCGKQDLVENFPKKVNANGEFKDLPNCHDCNKEVRKNYRLENKEKIRKYNRSWWVENSDYKKKYRYKNPSSRHLASLLKGAKSRNLTVEITPENLYLMFELPCHYCGFLDDQLNGIDRLNPNFGYIPGNVVPCCAVCNFGKQCLTESQFFTWIDTIVKYQLSKKEKQVNTLE